MTRATPIRLDDLRIASPCHARWADMTGDERVRHCGVCDRQVFDLSAMTRDEAEALLAPDGVRPCVRFYRRADGTIKTADCAPRARPSRRLAVVAGAVAAGTALAAASPAAAEPAAPAPAATAATAPAATAATADTAPPSSLATDAEEPTMGSPEYVPDPPRSLLEWSSWLRLGYGAASRVPSVSARSIAPPAADRTDTWEAALGADLSLPVARHGDVRVGAWTELRTSSGPVLGGELVLEAAPRHVDLFQYDGEGILAVRAGGNGHVVTAALAYGYLAPWDLWGHRRGATRYMIGARLVVSATRSLDDPRDWSATAGIEFEPIGALRYLLGISSWY